MVTFRSNNNRRPPFRSNNNRRPPFRGNNEGSKFSNNDNFRRSVPGRNNHNASKLIEKYNDLAREALSNEDRVLSENYFQHADHFTRILNEQESYRKSKFSNESSVENKDDQKSNLDPKIKNEPIEKEVANKKEEVETKATAAK
jgi:hypothetical protein